MFRGLFDYRPLAFDLGLLVIRVCASIFLLTHGIPKLMHFSERANDFADPIGLGSAFALGLTIFAEVFCSSLLLLGVVSRAALIPLIVLMLVIVFNIHAADPFGRKELPFFYLATFVTLFFTGPGRFSVDALRK